MIKPRSSSEVGAQQPEQEELEPESTETVAELLEQLDSVIGAMELSERDLRIAASFDYQLRHALDRADDLSRARAIVEKLNDRAPEVAETLTKPISRTRSLGGTVMSRLRRRT